MHKYVVVTACLVLFAVLGSAHAGQPQSRFQGLITFRNAPDPAGRTPVYWATSQTLHHVLHPRAAEAKFGPTWASQIRFCGDSNGNPLPGECSDIYHNFRRGNAITENTRDLLHP
ncbi:MAG: hypothetical protein AABZ10_11370 [Nitrospirota bacterium]